MTPSFPLILEPPRMATKGRRGLSSSPPSVSTSWASSRPAADGMPFEGGPTIDPATVLLLVGFVAIWLCLVLGGGAVHAWGSMTATLLLEGRTRTVPDRPQETLIDR